MRRQFLSITFVLVLLFGSFSHAQVGPKDGAELSPTDLDRVKIGDKAPDFTLENMDGKKISLSSFRGKQNVLLVFYRGRW